MMSSKTLSPRWMTSALEDESQMDITPDHGADGEYNFLRPALKSAVDDDQSMGLSEDEDMIDLSPRPTPPPESLDMSQIPALVPEAQNNTTDATESQLSTSNAPTNSLDEITFEDDEATPTADVQDISNVSHIQDQSIKETELQDTNVRSEGSEYPFLIDYSDVEEEAESHPQPQPQPQLTAEEPPIAQSINPLAEDSLEAVNENTLKENNDESAEIDTTTLVAPEAEQSAENTYHNDTYEEDTTPYTENPNEIEEQHKYSSHPVVVDYYNQWTSLFKGSLPELDCFNVEEDVLYGNISLVLEHLRKSQFVQVQEWEQLEIHVPALDLWIHEKSVEADQYSFADLLNTYLDLHSHDGHYSPDPMFLTLTIRPTFRHQLEKLQGVAGFGGGFSKCDFLRFSQPSFNLSNDESEDSNDNGDQDAPHEEVKGEEGNEDNNATWNHDSPLPGNYAPSRSQSPHPIPQVDEQEYHDEHQDQQEHPPESNVEAYEPTYDQDEYNQEEGEIEPLTGQGDEKYEPAANDQVHDATNDQQREHYEDQDQDNEQSLENDVSRHEDEETYEENHLQYIELYQDESNEQTQGENEQYYQEGDGQNYDLPPNDAETHDINYEQAVDLDENHDFNQDYTDQPDSAGQPPIQDPEQIVDTNDNQDPGQDYNDQPAHPGERQVQTHGQVADVDDNEDFGLGYGGQPADADNPQVEPLDNQVVDEDEHLHLSQDYDQEDDTQTYGEQEEAYHGGEGASNAKEYDQNYSHAPDNQSEASVTKDLTQESLQVQIQEDILYDNNDAGQLEIPEEELLIDYSDEEDIPVQSEESKQSEVPAMVQTLEDEITYSDDEGPIPKTPTKRSREEDGVGSEPKRVKS